MHFLKCRTCGTRVSIPNGDQFDAAAAAVRMDWVVEWKQNEGFQRPFLRVWCSTSCWKAGEAIVPEAFWPAEAR